MADEEKKQQLLQSKLVKDTIAEHAGHPGFWIKETGKAGINWDCSCKRKPKPKE